MKMPERITRVKIASYIFALIPSEPSLPPVRIVEMPFDGLRS